MSGPSVLSDFRQDVVSRATRASMDSARSAAHRVLTDIKNRAATNPTAALAIGAGLAWRIVRHPPISSVLVGLGVAALLKTDPERDASPVMVRAAESANSAAELVRGMGEETQEWATRGRRSASEMIDQVSGIALASAPHASKVTTEALGVTVETSDMVLRAVSRKDIRDNDLLGVAALAIGAAAVIAHQRRDG